MGPAGACGILHARQLTKPLVSHEQVGYKVLLFAEEIRDAITRYPVTKSLRISPIVMEFLLGFRPWLVSQPIRPPSTRLGPTPVRRRLVPCGRSTSGPVH